MNKKAYRYKGINLKTPGLLNLSNPEDVKLYECNKYVVKNNKVVNYINNHNYKSGDEVFFIPGDRIVSYFEIIIKEIRGITGLGLKEAKELADNGGTIKEGASKEEAEEIKAKLEAAGATVEVK